MLPIMGINIIDIDRQRFFNSVIMVHYVDPCTVDLKGPSCLDILGPLLFRLNKKSPMAQVYNSRSQP